MDLRKVQAILRIMPDADFDVSNGEEIIWRDNRDIPSDSDIDSMISIIEIEDTLALKKKSISDHIYSKYTRDKQTEDSTYVTSYITRLKAYGITDLESNVIDMVANIMEGSTIDEEINDIDDNYKDMYKKLIKVAFRTNWAELCAKEGRLAIEENRAPIYPPYPEF